MCVCVRIVKALRNHIDELSSEHAELQRELTTKTSILTALTTPGGGRENERENEDLKIQADQTEQIKHLNQLIGLQATEILELKISKTVYVFIIAMI